MPSTRELRTHIRSIRSTRQMTKAMELVAASKMRRASQATLASRPYVQRVLEVVKDLTDQPHESVTHPLLDPRPVKTTLLFVIASDRGLAGAYNANLVKAAYQFVEEEKKAHRAVQVITMGKRAELSMAALKLDIRQSYTHTPTHPTAADIAPITTYLAEEFLKGTFDAVQVLYTEFYSSLRQEARMRRILPLAPADIAEFFGAIIDPKPSAERQFLYEPNPGQVLDYILPRLVEAQLFQCLQESLASEHASRRIAMNNATENASSILEKLQLTYNSLRQGIITQEIAEITSGANALQE